MSRSDTDTTIQDLRTAAVAFRDARDWAQFHAPKDLAIAIGIEAAELAELFLWRHDDGTRGADESLRAKATDELADVLIYLLYMAEVLEIDVASAVFGKIRKNEVKYPVRLAAGTATKYDELG